MNRSASIRLIYVRPPNALFAMFGLKQEPEEVEVEVIEIDYDKSTAEILLPVPENSLLGIYAKKSGAPHPPPVQRTVPLESLKNRPA